MCRHIADGQAEGAASNALQPRQRDMLEQCHTGAVMYGTKSLQTHVADQE